MEELSQKFDVLAHLQDKGNISSMEAIKLYGATRLSAIIHDLRHNDGYNIVTQMEEGKTRKGRTCHYARYFLRGEHEKCDR